MTPRVVYTVSGRVYLPGAVQRALPTTGCRAGITGLYATLCTPEWYMARAPYLPGVPYLPGCRTTPPTARTTPPIAHSPRNRPNQARINSNSVTFLMIPGNNTAGRPSALAGPEGPQPLRNTLETEINSFSRGFPWAKFRLAEYHTGRPYGGKEL